MRSNFLITGSCLRVLYQSSLQGQSSQPAKLLGFGFFHVPGNTLEGLCCEVFRIGTKSQIKGNGEAGKF